MSRCIAEKKNKLLIKQFKENILKTNFAVNKTKLLIVYRGLEQAGSQRWIYEICKHLDKDKFQLAVLCDHKYQNAGQEYNYNNYYYLKLKELGITTYEYIGENQVKTLRQRSIFKIGQILNKALGKKYTKFNPKIVELFKTYDVICVIDFLGFREIKKEINKSGNKNFFIVMHSHKFQFSFDPYSIFGKPKGYNFTYFCPKQIIELSESGIDVRKNNMFFNPLVLNLTGYPNLFNQISDEPIVISIFTRINKMKPIHMFIQAFEKLQKLLQRKCVLNIYGEVQDANYHQELQNLIKTLGIDEETVRFLGHTKDIANTIKRDKINIYWGISINTSVGYASIEVGAMGVPSIYWNLDERSSSTYVQEQTGGLILSHNQVNDFVNSNLIYASDHKQLADFSFKQREYFIEKHNIVDKIKGFEEYIKSVEIQTT